MNTEELIVMGVLMILAGGLMVARHFVHTMEIPAPMATRKVDIGNTEEDLPINAAIAEALDVGDKQIATLKQRIFAQDRRIAELEERHERMVQNHEDLIATFSVAPARVAELEQRFGRMVQSYEEQIDQVNAMEYRLKFIESVTTIESGS